MNRKRICILTSAMLIFALVALPACKRETPAPPEQSQSSGIEYKAVYGTGQNPVSVATGSPGELGLLKVLGEAFCVGRDARLCWKKAGIVPSGDWYVVTGDFMVATLKEADAQGGYFMTDSSTWISEKKNISSLKVLFRGDRVLVNTYHALAVPPEATSGAALAAEFIDFVASEEGQDIIRDYGSEEFGEGLYNDAEYAKQYE